MLKSLDLRTGRIESFLSFYNLFKKNMSERCSLMTIFCFYFQRKDIQEVQKMLELCQIS